MAVASVSNVCDAYSTISMNTDNATIVLASPGYLNGWFLSNINAAPRYLKLYNKATAPTASDTPHMRILLPGNTAGAGTNINYSGKIYFNTGISFRLVTGAADNDDTATAAAEQMINLIYSKA